MTDKGQERTVTVKLWRRQEAGWQEIPVGESPVALPLDHDGHLQAAGAGDVGEAGIIALPFFENGRTRLALVAGPATNFLVNGVPAMPLAVLSDRDEIILGGEMIYFSAYAAPEPERFELGGRPVRCARCGGVLGPGDIVVRCPACLAFHHEGSLGGEAHAERPCWSYDPRCGSCSRRVEEFEWKPGAGAGGEAS